MRQLTLFTAAADQNNGLRTRQRFTAAAKSLPETESLTLCAHTYIALHALCCVGTQSCITWIFYGVRDMSAHGRLKQAIE